MHRGFETELHQLQHRRSLPLLSFTTSKSILFLCLALVPSISWANILYDPPKNNPLNIDWYPAPSPEDGPAASANASRDPALIPGQVGGIVGAYVGCLCIVGIAILCVGRKLRLRIRAGTKPVDIEMVHTSPISPTNFKFSPYPYPLTPNGQRNFSWPSPENDSKNPYVFPNSAVSPITPNGDDLQIDNRVLQADREMLNRDLEDIYAHVMEQEEAKAAGVNVKEMPAPLIKTGPIPVPAPQRTPGLKKDRRPSTLNFEETKKSRASSILSSIMSPRKKSSRVMQISSPLATPNSASFPYSGGSDEEPLTPRYYNPPPAPPAPPGQSRQVSHLERKTSFPDTIDEDRQSSYTQNEQDRKSTYPPRQQESQDTSPTMSIDAQLSQMNPYSRHQPTNSETSVGPLSAASATSQTPFFPALPASPRANKAPRLQLPPAGRSNNTLPFRQFETALQSPSFAPSTKTTVLERTVPQHSGPLTAGLKTPWSAGAVPYSPYQPFTPLMPMTPRLVTKEDRKAMKKLQPKTPVMEMVPDADDTW